MLIRKPAVLFPLLLLVLCAFVPNCRAAAPAGDVPVKIAILPFAMHTPGELNYLQSGIRDMLTSRLAWQGKVQIVDRVETEQATKGAKDISLNEALRIGGTLKADYVLFGSITGMGQSISIDAKMAPISGKAEPVAFYAQTKSLDEVIPQVNQFAQNINQKVFGKPGEGNQSASEAEMLATRNPEFLLPGALVSGDKVSYLNPNFVEVTPEGSLRQAGLWRSQTIQGGILGMDIGDVDGDGRNEVVTISRSKLTVYRKENQGLKTVASFESGKVDRFVWVCVADILKEGKAKIYLTSLRARNSSRGSADKSTDNFGTGEDVSSYVLSVSGGKIQVLAEKIPYFLNTLNLGQRGKVLVGQQKAAKTEGAFKGDIYEMQPRGNSLVPSVAVSAPSGCNIFNFAKADLKNDRMEEFVTLDDSHNLVVLNAAGDRMWKANNLFGATTNVFESKVEDRRFNLVELFAIHSPILITDLNKDGIAEIVLNRNTTSFDKFLPDSMKTYEKGEIVSLSWDQIGMVENWKTREIDGQITSIRIGDIDGSGHSQLILAVLHPKDLLKIWDAKSSIISYDLNINTAPAPAKTVATPVSGASRSSGFRLFGQSTEKAKSSVRGGFCFYSLRSSPAATSSDAV
jgi:TolB-like protein